MLRPDAVSPVKPVPRNWLSIPVPLILTFIQLGVTFSLFGRPRSSQDALLHYSILMCMINELCRWDIHTSTSARHYQQLLYICIPLVGICSRHWHERLCSAFIRWSDLAKTTSKAQSSLFYRIFISRHKAKQLVFILNYAVIYVIDSSQFSPLCLKVIKMQGMHHSEYDMLI